MNKPSFLCLGAGEGFHASQLQAAAAASGCEMHFATYESLRARVDHLGCSVTCQSGALDDYDAVLTRTMPAGSLEQVTFRLAMLHHLEDAPLPGRVPVINPPRALELAIDKFATLARVAQLGFAVPDTHVVQSRSEAMDAFRQLGGDCVVKPIFGGEGRGVMRIGDEELAWYAFSTLEQLDAVAYVQRFVPPGGRDLRLLVIGEECIAVRRTNDADFRTNAIRSSHTESTTADPSLVTAARQICDSMGLKYAAVDWIDCEEGAPRVIEVNGIPGWKGAQQVTQLSIAGAILSLLKSESIPRVEVRCG